MANDTTTTGTDTNGDQGTGELNPSAAIPTDQKPSNGNPAGQPTPDNNDGDTITLKKSDYNNLVGQRDRANNQNGDLNETVAAVMGQYLQDKAIEQAQKDYPNVPREVLQAAESPEALETIAKAYQQNFEKEREKIRKEIQVAGPDQLTAEQKAERLDKLKGSGRLSDAIALKMS